MWIGSDDWDWRTLSQRLPERSGGLLSNTHLWEQEGIVVRQPLNAGNYEEVEVSTVFGKVRIKFPQPFPEQWITPSPKPLIPFIVLEEIEFDLFKVVGVKGVGDGGMDGMHHEWGSIRVRVTRFLRDGYKVIAHSFNRHDPVVRALDEGGYLAPQSVDAWSRLRTHRPPSDK